MIHRISAENIKISLAQAQQNKKLGDIRWYLFMEINATSYG